ncbi:hypothetical protein JB92DRAFT_2067026 [Gautieria morchelliformis]|nr:hypothetical protein JB92DRAFT_2067026 [Gautieria morchelliformis]
MLPQHFNADFYSGTSQYVTPSYSGQYSQNPDRGPSASTSHSPPPQLPQSGDLDPPRKRQRSAVRPKRKRGNSVGDDNADNSPGSGSGSAHGSQRTVPKKKKANRACFHCQKAHLTCDDSRPCQRCVKRGLADKCTEGLRKKAKYLLDEEELGMSRACTTRAGANSSPCDLFISPSRHMFRLTSSGRIAALKQQQQQQKAREKEDPGNERPGLPPPLPPPRQELDPPQHPPQMSDSDPLYNLAFDPTYPFGSEAANLEYSILSAILGNPSPPDDSSRLNRHSNPDPQSSSSNPNGSYPQFATPSWPAQPPQAPQQVSPSIQPSFLHQPPIAQQNSFSGTPPYRPHIQHAQSYNATPTFQGSPPLTHRIPGVNTTIHQPQAQVHYAQPSWTESNSGQPSVADVSGASGHDTSYLRTNVPGQQQNLQYQAESQLQDPPTNRSGNQALAPLSPPPSNSSPGTPLAAEPNFPFQVPGQGPPARMQQQQLEEQEQQQRIARARASQLHQTAQWGISGGPAASTSAIAKNYSAAAAVLGKSAVQNDRPCSSVYEAITRRYDYTQGYHDLMRHLHARFDKNDILRIVRALAIVRPSLIALQMPLTEEDEVFVEKCFQRSLLELDKLISFGGTPTVVWRRTGEICLVGFEFTMLTGWTREELIGKSKYIYELFENQSTVEYYEKFAAHAFENTTQSVISHCVLMKPSGAPVPCAFCFSIRRDIFDLPNIIIGQWLPLL